jgi:hypothetical protein
MIKESIKSIPENLMRIEEEKCKKKMRLKENEDGLQKKSESFHVNTKK